MAKIDFDTSGAPETQTSDFDPLPAGWYEVVLEKSDIKLTKDGTGQRLACEYSVIGPTHSGRKLFGGFNLVNKSEMAVKISQQQMTDFIRACGKMAAADSEELHNIPVLARLKVKPASGGYEAGNEIVGFKAVGVAAKAVETVANAVTVAPWGR